MRMSFGVMHAGVGREREEKHARFAHAFPPLDLSIVSHTHLGPSPRSIDVVNSALQIWIVLVR